MDLFLIHALILTWGSIGIARRLTLPLSDQLLVAALLVWGDIVTTSLLLSPLHRLGDPSWFLTASLVLLGATGLLALLAKPAAEAPAPEASPHPWLRGAFYLTIVPLAGACLTAAWRYEPNQPDALAYQLPRVLYYLGQGSVAHFAAADARQIGLPFNHQLLQLFGFVYALPLQAANLFNVATWVLGGVAVYRFCVLCACGANAALITAWLTLTAAAVVAQASSTTTDLAVGVAGVCAGVFILRWQQTREARYGLLAGLAAGLAAGSELVAFFVIIPAGVALLAGRFRAGAIRPWLAPGLLACAASVPFALINLLDRTPGLGRMLAPSFLAGIRPDAVVPSWLGFLPLWQWPLPLTLLNEDLTGFGLSGLVMLLGGVWCLRQRKKPAGWFAALGFGWILAVFLFQRWAPVVPRNFIPAFFLLAPCLASVIETGCSASRKSRPAVVLALLLLALTSGWTAGIYVLANTSRPAAPVFTGGFVRPALPPLPRLLDERLSHQKRIAVDTDGVNELIFPVLARGGRARFTSGRETDPGAYHLLSRSSVSRQSGYQDLARRPAYTVIALPAKRTAGVEFLATLGRGAEARDYFGLETGAGDHPAIDRRCGWLVTLSDDPASTDGKNARLRVDGLNPGDRAQLSVSSQNDDGHLTPLTTLTASGETSVTITPPFSRLVFRALEAATGEELGRSELPYLSEPPLPPKPVDPARASNSDSIFVTDLVLAKATPVQASSALRPSEGPFPQWDIPLVRPATQAVVTLTIPGDAPAVARVQLSFSVRLFDRDKALLEVRFNGQVAGQYPIEGESTWLDQTLELTPQPGGNVLEFRDVPLKTEMNWQDYLERYQDVMKHLVTHNIPLEKGAREHYLSRGRAEGRTMEVIEPSVPHNLRYYFMFRKISLEGFKSP